GKSHGAGETACSLFPPRRARRVGLGRRRRVRVPGRTAGTQGGGRGHAGGEPGGGRRGRRGDRPRRCRDGALSPEGCHRPRPDRRARVGDHRPRRNDERRPGHPGDAFPQRRSGHLLRVHRVAGPGRSRCGRAGRLPGYVAAGPAGRRHDHAADAGEHDGGLPRLRQHRPVRRRKRRRSVPALEPGGPHRRQPGAGSRLRPGRELGLLPLGLRDPRPRAGTDCRHPAGSPPARAGARSAGAGQHRQCRDPADPGAGAPRLHLRAASRPGDPGGHAVLRGVDLLGPLVDPRPRGDPDDHRRRHGRLGGRHRRRDAAVARLAPGADGEGVGRLRVRPAGLRHLPGDDQRGQLRPGPLAGRRLAAPEPQFRRVRRVHGLPARAQDRPRGCRDGGRGWVRRPGQLPDPERRPAHRQRNRRAARSRIAVRRL
ncbi:MAG: D-alanyl-D-alanine carboxypeptidase, partial [uncultured Thermomicrobiales bacterium]